MAATSIHSHQSKILALFARASDGRLKAGDLKKKLGPGTPEGPELAETDRAVSALIEQGLVAVAGGKHDGLHPRPNATYRLTDAGKESLRPARPDFPDELLKNQEAFVLLQVFRAKEQKLTRSDLNAKLRSRAAERQLEFDTKAAPQTVDYHLGRLVEKRCLIEQRKGNSVSYTLDPERGPEALASAKQHDAVSFTLNGETLNALLRVARGSASEAPTAHAADMPEAHPAPAAPTSSSVGPEAIARYVERLRAGSLAGEDLIPIHEVRRLVAEDHGPEAASHPAFDPLLKRMRSEGQLELMAISDVRRATQEQLDASIPGVNETIFYIVVG
jgi:DNA-binding transcriptional ArsR family regulator